MAQLKPQPNLSITFTLELSETEIQALHALTAYGTEKFLDNFYKYFGRTVLHPHEKGLISVFETLRNDADKLLEAAKSARTQLHEKLK